jgi:hypothetical protein
MDFSAWLTKSQVAEALGVSTKTVEQLAKTGKIQQAAWRRPETGQTVAVYHPDDVARIAATKLPGPPTAFLVPDPPANGNGHGAALQLTRPPAVDPDPVRTLATVLLAAWSEGQKVRTEGAKDAKGANAFLTLAEAAVEARVSEALIRRWMRIGKLPFEREPRSQWTPADRGWRIRRKDLEAL